MIRFYYDGICNHEITFGFCGFGCGLLGESFLVKDVTLNRLIKKKKRSRPFGFEWHAISSLSARESIFHVVVVGSHFKCSLVCV